jgi:immune inhibitor A
MVEITGTLVPTWVVLPHSEAWYGAEGCDYDGHPDNGTGSARAVVDLVDAFNAISQTGLPGFDWADYDTDNNGVVDRVMLMHAGVGAESGYTVTDTFTIWSHSGDVMPAQGGYTPTAGIKVVNYFMQPENVEVGVLAHELGHDLGLPDYYDTSGGGTADPVWWAIMNTGSHSGPGAIGTMPSHFTSWSKFVFGWIDPVMITDTSATEVITIGQVSNPPAGTDDAAFVRLPDQDVLIRAPHSGSMVWWSNFDVAWGDARLAHDVDLTGASGTVTMTYWLNYNIETDWDFLFIEVSDDGGTTWEDLQAWDVTTGITVTTPDDYSDPHGRMADYGGKKYGISGDTHGAWVQIFSDLSAYAGSDVDIRFRYCTDAGFQPDGAVLDDVAVPAIGWSDDFEGASTWTTEVSSFAGVAPGEGWKVLTGGRTSFFHYYIAEWRNYDGFDNGLQYAYQTWLYDDPDEWAVNKMKTNAPGMLVWYRNSRYQDNHMISHLWDAPSTAPKGQLLIVDAHYNPYIRPEDNGAYALNTLPGRPQSTDAAFNLWGSHTFELTPLLTRTTPSSRPLSIHHGRR